MALPTTNITTTLVRNELGETTNNVGLLCRSDKTNMLSKKKPLNDQAQAGSIDSIKYQNTFRTFTANSLQIYALTYDKPSGGINSPYRLGDFREYDHSSQPYWNIVLLSVKNLDNSTPAFLVFGQRYKVEFKVTENLAGYTPSQILSNPFGSTEYMSYLTDVGVFDWFIPFAERNSPSVTRTMLCSSDDYFTGYGANPAPFMMFYHNLATIPANGTPIAAIEQQYPINNIKTWWQGFTAYGAPVEFLWSFMPEFYGDPAPPYYDIHCIQGWRSGYAYHGVLGDETDYIKNNPRGIGLRFNPNPDISVLVMEIRAYARLNNGTDVYAKKLRYIRKNQIDDLDLNPSAVARNDWYSIPIASDGTYTSLSDTGMVLYDGFNEVEMIFEFEPGTNPFKLNRTLATGVQFFFVDIKYDGIEQTKMYVGFPDYHEDFYVPHYPDQTV